MRKPKALNYLRYGFVLVMAAIFLIPFVWMASQSLKSLGDYYLLPPTLIPAHPKWQNYADMLTQFPIIRAAINSLIVAVLTTLLQLLTASLAGFAFATLNFRGSRTVFIIMLTQMMLPVAVILVPLFKIVQTLGWLDSFTAMTVPFAFTAYGTFMMTQFFRGIPKEIFEAARIDGASYFSIWWRIYLPLAPAGLATLGALAFVFYWNSLLWPLLVANNEAQQTLPIVLSLLIGMTSSNPQLVMAGAALAVFVPLVLFLSLQRFFVAGMVSGSVK